LNYFFFFVKIKEENIKMGKDYTKAKIYTIRNLNNPEDIYVGSTLQNYLCQRWAAHLKACRDGKKGLLYERMRETKTGDWYIELYENFPCNSIDELLKREGEVIRQIGTLNKNIAGRTIKEWYIQNKDIIMDRMKNYYKNNRDARLAYQNDYNNKKKHHKAKPSVVIDADTGLEGVGLIS
jgi:hypothetical protein